MLDYKAIKKEINAEKGQEVKELVGDCEKLLTPAKKEFLKSLKDNFINLKGSFSNEVGFSQLVEAIDTLNEFFDDDAFMLISYGRRAVPRKPRDKIAERARREAKKAMKEAEQVNANPVLAQVA